MIDLRRRPCSVRAALLALALLCAGCLGETPAPRDSRSSGGADLRPALDGAADGEAGDLAGVDGKASGDATKYPAACKNAFVELGGLAVMEVESVAVKGDWSLRTKVSGYTGKGYYEWKDGNNSTAIDSAGQSVLSYTFCINSTGRYHLQLRSAAPETPDHNDVWVRLPDSGAVRNKGSGDTNLGKSWIKVLQNNAKDQWVWTTKTVDNDPQDIFVKLPTKGRYRVELSGRSTLFKVDRIVLNARKKVTDAKARLKTNKESPKGS